MKAQLEHFKRGQRGGIYSLYDFHYKGEVGKRFNWMVD